MTNEEKFQLVIKFLDKVISEKRNLIVETGGYTTLSIWENVKSKNIARLAAFKIENRINLDFNLVDVGFIKLNISEDQLTELKYKSNIIREISENKIINHLKLI